MSFSYLFFFVMSLQNWNHFPFPAKSSPPSFFYVKQLSQTNKNQFMESSPCPTIGTAQKRNLHIFGPKIHGCQEGGPPFLNGSLSEAHPPKQELLGGWTTPPIWKNMRSSSHWDHRVPQFSGGTFQKIFELPPVISSFTFLGAIVTHLKLPIP